MYKLVKFVVGGNVVDVMNDLLENIGANFWLKAVMMILSKVAIIARSLCSSDVFCAIILSTLTQKR